MTWQGGNVRTTDDESVARPHAPSRYRELFESIPAACLLADRAGVIQHANSATVALLGGTEAKLRGRALSSLVDMTDTSTVRAIVRSGGVVGARIRRARGATFDAFLTAVPLEADRRVLVTIREATEARAPAPEASATEGATQMERALRDTLELLEREHAIRSQLEKTDRAKDRFIAILSHDLRGPINSVLGWAQLLRKEPLSREAREKALETIERCSRSQLALVEELLDVSRITADKMVLELVPLDLGVTARGLVEAFGPSAEEAGVVLEAVFAEGATVFADRRRLSQVITNLVTNALKFTPRGGRVAVRVDADATHAILEVEDDGRGIAPELLPDLFECFRQGASPATGRPGLGLGLYIVRQLVHLHGGTVEARSEGRGRGATFTVRLPLREMPPTVASERALPEESAPALDGFCVLVVDDEPDARDLLAAVLSSKGASVAAAADAAQAEAMFESCAPDVVVSDLDMPGGDGCELIRRLRARSDVPAIAVSGFASAKDAARAIDAGFDVHVGKPIEPGELVERIRDLARRSRRT